MSRMLARKPVYKFRQSLAAANIGTATWVQLIAVMPVPASAVEIFNGSNSTIKLSAGAAGAEDAAEISYYVLPGGSAILLPIEFAKGSRIAAKSADTNANIGSLILNFFA